MNIKKNSFMMLGLVFGVSVILYLLDVPMNTTSKSFIVPTSTIIPTIAPTGQVIKTNTPTSTIVNMSETISYTVRGIPETLMVNLTLNGSIVNDLQLTQNTNNGESAAYQDAFLAEVKQYVVGKNIKNINVSRVAGASYTSDAFMQAIQNIKSKI